MADKINYLNMEVKLVKIASGRYAVHVTALNRQAEEQFADPFNADKRTIIRHTLTTAALLRSAKRMRSSGGRELKTMQEVGATLFQGVMHGPVELLYYQCLGQAVQENQRLRVRLILDPALSDLPWEFLYSPEKEFLGLNPQTSVVRYIEQPTPAAPLKAELPLKLLVVIASPSDQDPLDAAAEKQRIASALQPLQAKGRVQVNFVEGPGTWPRLIEALRPDDTHILHFIGHGMFDDTRGEGVLVMENEAGKSHLVGSNLLKLLAQGRRRLRLVVLNSCLGAVSEAEPLSSVAAGLVRAGVPAVIAMQFQVSDAAARIIAETFYRSLALNFPVDAALTEARRQIALLDEDSLEWATPVLFMQVPDGQLFDFTQSSEPMGPISPDGLMSEPEKRRLDLTPKAAKRYREAEEAVARGDWAEAIEGYAGALMFVPDYRDAEKKLAHARRQQQCVMLYQQARQHYAEKRYEQAGTLLAQIINLEPRWVDTDNLQQLSECGYTYQQAINALVAGDRQRGVVFLRQVIDRCPDFGQALGRLENLADGGDGLTGFTDISIPAQPLPPIILRPDPRPKKPERPSILPGSGSPLTERPVNTVTPPAQPAAAARLYSLPSANLKQLAEELQQYLTATGCRTQILQPESTFVVQGQKGGPLESALGTATSATIVLEPTDAGFKASVGGGKWADKAVAALVGGLITGGISILTAGYGALQQKNLEDALWQRIERYVARQGGQRAN